MASSFPSASIAFSAVALMRAKEESAANPLVATIVVMIKAIANQNLVILRRSFLRFFNLRFFSLRFFQSSLFSDPIANRSLL
jgi:hypothetical protein